MSDFIKINSADRSIGKAIIELNHLESVFEYDEKNNVSSVDEILENIDKSIIDWGHKARRILLKSKTKEAQDLINEYEELYEEFISDLKDLKSGPQKFTILKCFSGNFYRAQDTLEEIEELILEAKQNNRMGINQ